MSEDNMKEEKMKETREIITCSEGGGVKGRSEVAIAGASNNNQKTSDMDYSIAKCFGSNYSQLVHASDLAESQSNKKT